MLVHPPLLLPRPVLLRDWRPEFPAGDLRSVSLHWTAGDYAQVFTSYHFCLTGPSDVSVVATHDLRANMRDLRVAPQDPYAAHTAGRNSWSIGLAACAMAGATPAAFGAYPITPEQIEALCRVAALLAAAYEIPTVSIRTHAEAALADGYFGAGAEERWDGARLQPRPEALTPAEARATGDALRARIAALR